MPKYTTRRSVSIAGVYQRAATGVDLRVTPEIVPFTVSNDQRTAPVAASSA